MRMRRAFALREGALVTRAGCADCGPFVDLDVGVVAIDLVEAGHAGDHQADGDF
jgi:hypothetical protein